MIASECVGCRTFPCTDVLHQCYIVPGVEVNPDAITIIMISEAAPASASDYYYSGADSLFERTSLQAFNDAGLKVRQYKNLSTWVYISPPQLNVVRQATVLQPPQ